MAELIPWSHAKPLLIRKDEEYDPFYAVSAPPMRKKNKKYCKKLKGDHDYSVFYKEYDWDRYYARIDKCSGCGKQKYTSERYGLLAQLVRATPS